MSDKFQSSGINLEYILEKMKVTTGTVPLGTLGVTDDFPNALKINNLSVD